MSSIFTSGFVALGTALYTVLCVGGVLLALALSGASSVFGAGLLFWTLRVELLLESSNDNIVCTGVFLGAIIWFTVLLMGLDLDRTAAQQSLFLGSIALSTLLCVGSITLLLWPLRLIVVWYWRKANKKPKAADIEEAEMVATENVIKDDLQDDKDDAECKTGTSEQSRGHI